MPSTSAHRLPPLHRARAAAACAFACAAALAFALAPPARAAVRADDPLAPMLRRMDDYLQTHQVEGVSMDWRYAVSPSEEIRQTVVCQVLAYVELYRLDPRARLRVELVRHSDFMLARMDTIRSHGPFDGMLGYALLAAGEVTGEQRFLDAGAEVTNEMMAIPTEQCVLNGGLMVAMATAEYAKLTGDTEAAQKTRDILAQLAPYQNADGSFPHWCWGSRDIHYTGWMAMELIHLRRFAAESDTTIDGYLGRMNAFLEGRIGPGGRAIYEQPCPGTPGCTEYFYSRATGCWFDYDSRAWTVEPAYCVLLFDHMGSPQYAPVMAFMDSLENGGTFSDQYAYWPPPSDPEYPWTIADTSVVNMSIIFWALATAVTDRIQRGVPVDLVLDDLIDTTGTPPGPPPAPPADRPVAAYPNPARGACTLRYSLASRESGAFAIYDAGGRRVRTLESGRLAAGPHVLAWDGRDDDGRRVPAGVYFARVRTATRDDARRFVFGR